MTLTGDTMLSVARDVAAGAAKRRRERRYRSFWRHELMAVKMATLTACHHSAQKKPAATHAATQTDGDACAAPATSLVNFLSSYHCCWGFTGRWFISSLGRLCGTRRSDDPEYELTSTSIDRLVELPKMLDMISSYKDVFSPLVAQMENIEKETERVAMLTKRMLEPPMVEPPFVESDRASAKRRRRTRYTPLPGVMENAVYLAPSAWPPMPRA